MFSSSAHPTIGASAWPAGKPGMMQMTGPSIFHSPPPAKHCVHALRHALPYHDMTPAGWKPKEPATKPTAGTTGAGCISQGSIDNTYLVNPLKNAWGKSRALMTNEHRVSPRTQVTDLLAVAKGFTKPAPAQTIDQMNTVRLRYSHLWTAARTQGAPGAPTEHQSLPRCTSHEDSSNPRPRTLACLLRAPAGPRAVLATDSSVQADGPAPQRGRLRSQPKYDAWRGPAAEIHHEERRLAARVEEVVAFGSSGGQA